MEKKVNEFLTIVDEIEEGCAGCDCGEQLKKVDARETSNGRIVCDECANLYNTRQVCGEITKFIFRNF